MPKEGNMKEKGMKSATMPKDHWEKDVADVGMNNLKYASKSTMENPEDLKKSVDALSSFVKSHQMKY